MADMPPADQPDIAAALTLMNLGMQTLAQAVEGIAAAVPAAGLQINGVRRAQANFHQAMALLTPPAADPPVVETSAPEPEPAADPIVAEPVDPAPPDPPMADPAPEPADPPPSPDPQPEDNDG